ncbi:hypothetical protein MNBD_GAMMA22-7 [hydrothermal vent metagenome]|uniref:4'-phosphopantetheinyl transferase entD n=1 Tax=hydrothermal vent metagenome TaxID=652676 RepID=A0A3B0ZP38_9ZZZZ
MINSLLPNNIACEFLNESTSNLFVHEAEVKSIQHASKKRVTEFLNARHCAHKALIKIGYTQNAAILQGTKGEPLWPKSIIGSITHCKGYYAAVVSFNKFIVGIGIDAELNMDISQKLILTTQTENEIFTNTKISNKSPNFFLNKLVFSAKESVFKFLFPIVKRYIKFKEIEINLNINKKTFSVILLNSDISNDFDVTLMIGKFDYDDNHIVTCCYQQQIN